MKPTGFHIDETRSVSQIVTIAVLTADGFCSSSLITANCISLDSQSKWVQVVVQICHQFTNASNKNQKIPFFGLSSDGVSGPVVLRLEASS